MKKFLICLLLLCGAMNVVFSQATLRGSISDSTEKKILTNTVVLVLRQSDSVIVKFARTDKNGHFTIAGLPSGKAIIMITHPGYADYIDQIELDEQADRDLGSLFLYLKSQLLQEVIVSNAAAIRIKGDTTEYKADSFYLKPGSTVEDLLKKLPGIQVDKNGKITAQGEAVQKVLVDGEEFFSDDPTVVTQNMTSDAIDKVQVYDKKSDQAAFTGIDDGQKSKTIDLKLKEGRKKGYFGKVQAGTDGKNYWNNSAMLNAFKGKRKFSAYGIMSSTGKTGLDWNENTNYGGSSNMEMSYEDDGMMFMYMGGDGDDLNQSDYYGEGFPKGWNGGLLYSNKWNSDKTGMNSSYQFRKLNTAARGTILSKYILPDTLYYINQEGNNYSSRDRHSLRGTFESQIDSLTSLKITAEGYKGNSLNSNYSIYESLDDLSRKVNRSDRRVSSEAQNKNLNTTLLLRRKFKKQGRTLSLNVQQRYNEIISDGLLFADYEYYDQDGLLKQDEQTDQQKLKDNTQSSLNTRAVYTEPLSKRSLLEFNYSLNNAHGKSRVTSLGKMIPNSPKYEAVIDSLSNDYSLNVLTNSAGMNYRYSKPKKINFSFGGNISRADFQRTDRKTDSGLSYKFINLFPRAMLNMTMPGGGNLYLNYNGSTQPPTIDQIQPVKDNTDQLNQRIGNPDLKQSFRQQFALSFHSFKLLSERSMYMSGRYSVVHNDFSSMDYVDELGRRLTQPVNVNGNRYFDGYLYYGKKLKKSGISLGVNINLNHTHNTNFINALKNINNSYNVGAGPNLRYSKDKKFEIYIGPRGGFTRSTSSIRPDEPTQYWTQDHYIDATIFLPWKLEFNTDCTFSLREKTDAFDRNTNATRWNARLDKKFLKKDAAVLRFSAFDLLDQNFGFQRNATSNFISERTYDSFRRYFMLSFILNFNRNGQPQ